MVVMVLERGGGGGVGVLIIRGDDLKEEDYV